MKKLKNNFQGFTITEVMVSVGLVAITMLAVSSLVTNILKENKAIEQKVAILDLNNNLVELFAKSDKCIQVLNISNPTLDLSSSASVSSTVLNFDEIKTSVSATTVLAKVNQSLPGFSGNDMKVASIQFKSLINADNPNHFKGQLEVKIASDSMVLALKPIVINQIEINVKPNPDMAHAQIVSCGAPTEAPTGVCIQDADHYDPRILHDGTRFKCCYNRPVRKVKIHATHVWGLNLTKIVSINWTTQTIKANAYFSYCRHCPSNYSGGEVFFDSECGSDKFQVGYSVNGAGVGLEPWRSGPVTSSASGSCGQNATVTAEVVNEFPGEPPGAPLNYMFCDDLN